MLFRRVLKKRGITGAVEGSRPVVFLLGAQNVGGAPVARQQILALLRIEETLKRRDAGHDQKKIVLTRQSEHRVDEIVPRAALAQIDFEPLAEKTHELIE